MQQIKFISPQISLRMCIRNDAVFCWLKLIKCNENSLIWLFQRDVTVCLYGCKITQPSVKQIKHSGYVTVSLLTKWSIAHFYIKLTLSWERSKSTRRQVTCCCILVALSSCRAWYSSLCKWGYLIGWLSFAFRLGYYVAAVLNGQAHNSPGCPYQTKIYRMNNFRRRFITWFVYKPVFAPVWSSTEENVAFWNKT